ncbi:MAG: hypothetical protein KIG65_03245 [Eubacteriales bacterium]|nr:hypothetical protein [Eubacteriales bacterium]
MNIKEIERVCLGQFEANRTLFQTTVKDNIEKNRKGRKTVVIKDKTGAPLVGVKVKANLKNHEFRHGAHIFMLDQFETVQENEEFRRLFSQYYNLATIPFYWEGLEVMSAFGKPLEITEVTIPTLGDGNEAEDIQAEVIKYLYTLWFSSANLESVVYWNSFDKTAYSSPDWDENRLNGGLFHRDLTPKKSAQVFKKLFKQEWHTELEIVSDESGKISFEGFHGDYEVCVQPHNEAVYCARLYKDNQEVEVICAP